MLDPRRIFLIYLKSDRLDILCVEVVFFFNDFNFSLAFLMIFVYKSIYKLYYCKIFKKTIMKLRDGIFSVYKGLNSYRVPVRVLYKTAFKKGYERWLCQSPEQRKRGSRVYKLLNRFSVSTNEFTSIAKGYKEWLNHPVEKLPPYRTVYCYKGELYAMPYTFKELEGQFVGIEINNTLYLLQSLDSIAYCELCSYMVYLRHYVDEMFEEKSKCCFPGQLRMPTSSEFRAISRIKFCEDWKGASFTKQGYFWITISSDYLGSVSADADRSEKWLRMHKNQKKPEKNNRRTKKRAILFFVSVPPRNVLNKGYVDKYGRLTKQTREMLKKMKSQ